MNKFIIFVLIMLFTGLAMAFDPSGIFSSLTGGSSSCGMSENCTGNCSGNCSENCSKNCSKDCISQNNATGSHNNFTEQNCSVPGPCPIRALQENGRCTGRWSRSSRSHFSKQYLSSILHSICLLPHRTICSARPLERFACRVREEIEMDLLCP